MTIFATSSPISRPPLRARFTLFALFAAFTFTALAAASLHATSLQLVSVGAKTKARMKIDGTARELVVGVFTDEGLLLERVDGDYVAFTFNGESKRMRVGEVLILDSQTQGFVSHQVRADQKDRYMTPIAVNGGAIAQAEIDRLTDTIIIPVADADRLGIPYKEKPARSFKVPLAPAVKDESKEAREQREAKNAELTKAAKDGKPATYKTYAISVNSLRVGSIDIYGVNVIVSEKPGLTHAVLGKPYLRRVAPSWSNRVLTLVRR